MPFRQFGMSSRIRRATGAVIAVFGVAAVASGCASSRSLSASIEDIDADNAVHRAFRRDETPDFVDVDVTIFEGRLLLTGSVPTQAAKRRMVNLASRADRFIQIIDETVVRPETGFSRGFADGRIDTELRARLTANAVVRGSDIKIAVSDGVVYLLGTSYAQRDLASALNTARTTRGVKQVVSHLIYMDGSGPHL